MRKMTQKWMAISLAAVLSASLLAGCAAKPASTDSSVKPAATAATTATTTTAPAATPAAATKTEFVLGAGALGGNYYTIGGALGDVLMKKVDTAKRISVVSGGNLSFLPQLQEGKLDIALSTPDAMYFAWSGEGGQGLPAGKKHDKINLMAAFFVNIMDIVVLDKSSVKTIKDIGNGKVGVIDVSLKAPMEEFMMAYGIAKPNVVVISDWNQMSQSLRDGGLAAMQAMSAHPIPAITELSNSVDVRLLQANDEAAIAKFLQGKDTKFFQKAVQPMGTYKFQKEDYHTVGRGSTMVVSTDVSEEQVYKMTKAIYENTEDLVKIHPLAKSFSLKTLQDYLDAGVIRIPLHPGARKYFEEKGVKIPDSVPKK